MTRHLIALAGASALLIALPWLVLSRAPGPVAPPPPADDRPLRPAPPAAIDALLDRDPFQAATPDQAPDDDATVATPGESDGPPRIVGIAGRLPDKAVVLVRRDAGGTRMLAVGEAVGRWRLVSIAADAALFDDGTRRVRVELPIADPPQ